MDINSSIYQQSSLRKAARILPPVAITLPDPHQALYHQDTHIFESTVTPGLYWRQPIELGHHHIHYITVQMQQSHSSSPQSQPKHGFWTDLMGFLMEDPELEDGRMKFTGDEMEEAPILTVCFYGGCDADF
ncbi:hypothetical protein BDV30DRAFT_204201 [Aspergillus minisclerotigenes]|uniref:Uncharacterized protein n=1 Tax=Aspergillus minisclerotigenes TaxID=656917 RepID=A0A5N6JH34_9EURO|nr:hypothetical protein BDV30DRAFT_204201 [Aspergillus minisclerotigenes]